MMCLGVDLFGFILLRIYSALDLCLLANLGSIQAIISLSTFSGPLSPFSRTPMT